MIMGEREREIAAIAAKSSDVLVFARTLLHTAGTDSLPLLEAVANVALNRFLYERDISGGARLVDVLTDPRMFPCWRKPRAVPALDASDAGFGICFRLARRALAGLLPDNAKGAIRFRRRDCFPLWATGLAGCAAFGEYVFYNNCD
jgi:hypothetical protein